MTTPLHLVPAVTVAADDGLERVVDALQRTRVPALAVVDGAGRVLGAVDRDDHPDLSGWSSSPAGVRVAGTARQRRRRDRRAAATARDLMAPAVTVSGEWDDARVMRLLAQADAPLAFVVDRAGRLLGSVAPVAGQGMATRLPSQSATTPATGARRPRRSNASRVSVEVDPPSGIGRAS